MTRRPEAPLEMIVFRTTLFCLLRLYAINVEQAFIKRDVIKITRVPATKKLMLKLVNCRFFSALINLNIIRICALFSCLNSGFCSINFLLFLDWIMLIFSSSLLLNSSSESGISLSTFLGLFCSYSTLSSSPSDIYIFE